MALAATNSRRPMECCSRMAEPFTRTHGIECTHHNAARTHLPAILHSTPLLAMMSGNPGPARTSTMNTDIKKPDRAGPPLSVVFVALGGVFLLVAYVSYLG